MGRHTRALRHACADSGSGTGIQAIIPPLPAHRLPDSVLRRRRTSLSLWPHARRGICNLHNPPNHHRQSGARHPHIADRQHPWRNRRRNQGPSSHIRHLLRRRTCDALILLRHRIRQVAHRHPRNASRGTHHRPRRRKTPLRH